MKGRKGERKIKNHNVKIKMTNQKFKKNNSLILHFTFLFLISLMGCKDRIVASPISETTIIPLDEVVEIPAGSFIMGSEDGEFDERPLHNVELDSFYMDRYEVTNLQYQNFISANPHWQKGNYRFDEADDNYLKDWNGAEFLEGKENYPVVYISWYAASAYCKWTNKFLPTEAQWEYAARGSYEGMKYVWGNFFESHLINNKGVMPVDSYSINGFGLNGMAGNVWEWTADGYELYMEWVERNPTPRLNNHLKVIRGGSWKSGMDDLRVSVRRTERPNACRGDVGFRCIIFKLTTDNQ